MIKALYAAEFDLVKGCVITASYPIIVNTHELASYMIPDGVHKIRQDKFFFRIGTIKLLEGQVQTFHYDYQWSPLFKSAQQTLSYIDGNSIKILSENINEWLDINLTKAQIQVISDDFVAITVNPNLIYGLKCKFTQDIYLACLRNKKNSQIKRGSLVRSIAVCSSELLFFGICDQIIEKCLDEYFNNVGLEHWEEGGDSGNCTAAIQSILEKGFIELSNALTYHQFQHSLLDYSSKDSGTLYPKGAEGLTINASVLELIQRFNMKIRILYRAILQQKRIVILVHECSNQSKQLDDHMYNNASNLLASLCFLVKPLNIIQNIQGYKSLLDSGWEQQNNWISIVSNPIFESRKEWWDLFCDINAGKIIESKTEQSLFVNNETDIDFFQSVINLIQESHINELQLRQILFKHTQSIIGNLSQTLYFESYRKLKLKEIFNEKQYPQLINIITILKSQKNMEDIELLKMYETLLDCIKTEEQFKEFFKIFTESGCSYNSLGIGTICQDILVQEKCRDLLKYIEKFDKLLLKKVNLLFVI